MKKFALTLNLLIIMFTYGHAQFKSGEEVTIERRHDGDLYIGAGTVKVNAPIVGDLVVGGGEIDVADSVYQDLLISGGIINVIGPVLDDMRAAGGDIKVRNTIGDDLLVFGGRILVDQDAEIAGDLIVFGGEVNIDGHVVGNVKSYGGKIELDGSVDGNIALKGGEITIDGIVKGSAEIAAEELVFGNSTQILGNLDYWTEDGEISMASDIVNGTTTFSESLGLDRKGKGWLIGGGIVFTIILFILYIIAAFIFILVLNLLFGKYFAQASEALKDKIGENLGFGFLYLIGMPIIIIIAITIVVGLPIGVFLACLFIFSLLFGHSVASLLLIHHLNKKRERKWNAPTVALLALLIVVVLRIITLVPFVGWLISLLVIAMAYGTLINHIIKRKKLVA